MSSPVRLSGSFFEAAAARFSPYALFLARDLDALACLQLLQPIFLVNTLAFQIKLLASSAVIFANHQNLRKEAKNAKLSPEC